MNDDLRLQRAVLDGLVAALGGAAARVGVSVSNGVVTLHGTVRDDAKRLRAQYTAEGIVGVHAVIDATQLRSAEQAALDAQLAEHALSALHADPHLRAATLKVRVEDGWLTMDGVVESEEMRQAARRALRHLFGIRGLSNLVRVGDVPDGDDALASGG